MKFFKTDFGIIINLEKISYVDVVDTNHNIKQYSVIIGDSRVFITHDEYDTLELLLLGDVVDKAIFNQWEEDYKSRDLFDELESDNETF